MPFSSPSNGRPDDDCGVAKRSHRHRRRYSSEETASTASSLSSDSLEDGDDAGLDDCSLRKLLDDVSIPDRRPRPRREEKETGDGRTAGRIHRWHYEDGEANGRRHRGRASHTRAAWERRRRRRARALSDDDTEATAATTASTALARRYHRRDSLGLFLLAAAACSIWAMLDSVRMSVSARTARVQRLSDAGSAVRRAVFSASWRTEPTARAATQMMTELAPQSESRPRGTESRRRFPRLPGPPRLPSPPSIGTTRRSSRP